MKNTFLPKALPLLVVLLITALSYSSCKKYDEGPLLSLHTQKARLKNYWIMEKVLKNGADYTRDFLRDDDLFLLNLTEDDRFYWYTKKDGITTSLVDGGWTLNSKEDWLNMSTLLQTPDRFCSGYKIIRLTQKEFWVKTGCINQDELEIHFKSPK